MLLSSAVFLTIVSSLAIGVVSGYITILGLLRLFCQRPRKERPAAPAAGKFAEVAGD